MIETVIGFVVGALLVQLWEHSATGGTARLILLFIVSVCFFVGMLLLSAILIDEAMSSNPDWISAASWSDHGLFAYRVLCVFGSFLFALISLHSLLYCFGGWIKKTMRILWPKGIDYVYYLFAALLLLTVVAEIYDPPDEIKKTTLSSWK
jgi:hypothetical protein